MIGLPLDDATFKKRKFSIVAAISFIVFLFIILFSTNLFEYFKIAITAIPKNDSKVCPVSEIIAPKSFYKDNSTVVSILNDANYKEKSIKRVSGAIQIDTQIFDNQPSVDKSPETWKKFAKFHSYLQNTFPLVYENLNVETVNTFGLVYTWKGSNKDLKPILLAAHQDTVPIQKDTLNKWTYPPLEGHYDGKFIYGRGAADCKNVLIAILETLQLLLSQNYKPERTIIAAFGFDEESSGIQGASHIANHLESKWGKDSFYAVVDEGPGLTTDTMTDTIIATPGTGEKGYIDILVELETPGGHSSIPPDHTSIGIISELGYLIEKDPYSPVLTPRNPIFNYFQCLAVHDPKDKIPSFFKKIIMRSGYDKFANAKLIEKISQNKFSKYLIRTSQALDIISGGEKANALPENTKLLVNHRIAIESNIEFVKQQFTARVIEVAKRHNIKVKSFGKSVYTPEDYKHGSGNGGGGEFTITATHEGLEAAPLTPTNDTVWQYLSGVTRHVYEDLVFTNLTYPIVSSPAIMTGNTDTRYYWNLTRNIFRYSPFYVDSFIGGMGIHSVDEKLNFDGHLQLHAWFYEYLQAIDTVKADN
ncbi:CPS1 [Candida oxycetoniae]|uniref:CPS1 n=1 Tax=Candida oxycetoniae TaxID=497107 RepID=A0AAI9SVC3_9ASCO|nr:CPS1 [Candida oxycetoniae]KAI3403179.2 CPS1 [Candida oxycetoniae]